ncbi:MAG: SLATT domain-containing protein [Hyphomicrobiaceae bacterium]|nr:SLATT domain-containing protein [Hyphomicrobiaceae bacterium]
MAHLDTPARHAPSIVALEDGALRRRASAGGVAASSPVDQLVRAMHTVKAARFNAAERLQYKHLVSVVALSIVSLYFVGLSVWQAVYAVILSEHANRLITLVSIMSSICTLVLALIDSMNDYKIKAHHMHTCALAVNDLLQELRLADTHDPVVVQDFRRRYNNVVRGCPYNHSRIDYLMARSGGAWQARLLVKLRYAADVYGLYGACLATPPMVMLLFR